MDSVVLTHGGKLLVSANQELGNRATEFFREVSKYFMDFLETDFHKRRLPRRSIKYRDSNNFLIGFALRKYPSFNEAISKNLKSGFQSDGILNVQKGVHKTRLPSNIIELVKLQISKLTDKQLTDVLSSLANRIEQEAVLNKEDFEIALSNCLETAGTSFYSEIVSPFISSLEKPLTNNELGDQDDIFVLAQSIVDLIVNQIDEKVSSLLKRLIVKEHLDAHKELTEVLTFTYLQKLLHDHFSNLEVIDLFYDLQDIENNKAALDKQELYLYLGDISFRQNKYPIFYIPLNVIKSGDNFRIEFDSQVYVNKKAIDYIVQEFNTIKGGKGTIESISERIIYLNSYRNSISAHLSSIMVDIENFFEVQGHVDLSSSVEQRSKGVDVTITNNYHISLFDKSDEALINDYEEILADLSLEGAELSSAFTQLLSDFLEKNPDPVGPEIESAWDETEIPEKLVQKSPIPLNSEQIQILNAVRNPKGKYLIVEGPPGTGKSHTITAIIFDAILNNKNVLVLSDKKEALDVVEKNIVETMNKVRFDSNFQNPILRLGKTGNTYSQILSKTSLADIKLHYRTVKKDIENIDESIEKLTNSLREEIELETLAYSDIDIEEIQELYELEEKYPESLLFFDLEEVLRNPQGGYDLKFLLDGLYGFRDITKDVEFIDLCEKLGKKPVSFYDYVDIVSSLSYLSELLDEISRKYNNPKKYLQIFDDFRLQDLEHLKQYRYEYQKCKSPIFGYLFTKGRLSEIDRRFVDEFKFVGDSPSSDLETLETAYQILLTLSLSSARLNTKNKTHLDYVALAHSVLVKNDFADWISASKGSFDLIGEIPTLYSQYPNTFSKCKLSLNDVNTFTQSNLLKIDTSSIDEQIRYIQLHQKVRSNFANVPQVNYAIVKQDIEQLVTTKVANQLDGRVIDFYENNKNDAEVLKNIIKSKQKFPKKHFNQLKQAFPCILAGIRDFAEYIPLHHEMFDILIIDEASQVSLAQAFPALIRAKKVLILGDRKQFSNIKAAQARSDTNREYLSRLAESFKRNISKESDQLLRLDKFNIKTSVLEFFEFISNYNMQLIKHFRGYKELISYSNKYFYRNGLQVMKIRGKDIKEVLKFSFLPEEDIVETNGNSNLAEVEFIISELKLLKESGYKESVGIITPHTDQQKLLVDRISRLPERDHFYEVFKLKIMTFDTCQGEERDLIFYSMVASKANDKLWGVFIKDLNNVDIEEDGKIKAQRLNVGFSRAKECMHFVLSKPLDQYSGSIGEALRHYWSELENAEKELSASATDKNSAMESHVLHWFYQTQFWLNNRDKITFIPQFEIGKYLKQLDPTYTHPRYKVDFLVVFKDINVKKIVIEYDGFQEHFNSSNLVNELNHEIYLSDSDIYRQKVLESYGYKFIRINKFNSGKDPIGALNKWLEEAVKAERPRNNLIVKIKETIEGLDTGGMKECPKCNEIKSIENFRDSSLATGIGRFCVSCKKVRVSTIVKEKKSKKPSTGGCPKCGAVMIRRAGKYGAFYGCSRFPYCKGTRR